MKYFTYQQAAETLSYTSAHVCSLVKIGKLGKKFPNTRGYEITQKDIDNYQRPKMGRPPGQSAKLPNGKILTAEIYKGATVKQLAKKHDVTVSAVYNRMRREKATK